MKEKAEKIKELLVQYRRDFHRNPELGFQEQRTSAIVANTMESLGYRVQRGVARTGVVAELGSGAPVIGIRADMDALPILEANDVPYVSATPGVMHACGHDAHTAIALGVATLMRDETFPGTVRFLFQPSEDSDDEYGVSGAPRMIEAGALEGLDAILALHVDAPTEVGLIKMKAGMMLAGTDLFEATIIGRGGHGGSPHEALDPIYLAGHVVLAIHAIKSRRIGPTEAAVISMGTIHGGTADTIIPESVVIKGSIRYADPDVRQAIHEELTNALAIARAFGGDYELKISPGSPPTINDPRIVSTVIGAAEDLFGREQVTEYKPLMAGEDFANYGRLVPAGIFLIGCRMEDEVRRHHDPRFDVNEACLPIGAAVLAEVALRLLRGDVSLAA